MSKSYRNTSRGHYHSKSGFSSLDMRWMMAQSIALRSYARMIADYPPQLKEGAPHRSLFIG